VVGDRVHDLYEYRLAVRGADRIEDPTSVHGRFAGRWGELG
jgi:hypothetical protein